MNFIRLLNGKDRVPKSLFAAFLVSPLFFKVSFGNGIIVHPIALVLGITWIWIVFQVYGALRAQRRGIYAGEWQCWNIQAVVIALLVGGLALSHVLSDLREAEIHEQGWLLWIKLVLYWAPLPLAAILAYRVGAQAVKLACYLLPMVGVTTIGYSFYRLRDTVGEKYSQAYIESSPEHQAMGMLGEVLTGQGLIPRDDTVSQGAYGIYLVIILLFSMILALFSRMKIGGISARYAQIQAWVVGPLAVIALLFTASRTSLILMVLALGCLTGLTAWNPGSVLSASRFKVLGGFLAFIACVLFIGTWQLWPYIPTLTRMVATVECSDFQPQAAVNPCDTLGEIKNINSRIWIWSKSINYLIDHPVDLIFGIGYDRTVYRGRVLNMTLHDDVLINSSHNIYLDMLIKGGIVTLAALVALCMIIVWWTMVSFHVRVKEPLAMDIKAISWFFLCFWVPFLVINLWGDELITDNAMIHWTSMFGLMVGLLGNMRDRLGVKNVVHISAAASVGGGPLYVTALIRDQVKKGYTVSVVTSHEKPYFDVWRAMGISVSPILVRKASLLPGIRLVKLLNDRPGLVHAHGRGAAFYALWPKILLRAPALYTPNGPHYIGEKNVRKVIAWIIEWCFRKVFDTVTYVSHGEFELARKHWFPLQGSNVVLSGFIENGDDSKLSGCERRSVRRELGISENEIVIGWIGRNHYQKALEILLESIPYVAREIQDVVWIIVGSESPEGTRLKLNRGVDESVWKRIFFLGEVPEAFRIIPALDVYISTSRWEGLPLVLLEVMNQGKAIAATDVPGNRDVLEGWGHLFPPNNPFEAAKAQIRMARYKALREEIGRKGKDVLKHKFAAERMFQEIDGIYRHMMSLQPSDDDISCHYH